MVEIGTIEPADWRELLTLNNAAVPHVNALTIDGIRRIGEMARAPLRAELDGRVAGFVIALAPGTDYASPNYRWFAELYPDFLYVDRIVVADHARRAGVARCLYDAVFSAAADAPVCCEVNLQPPNEASMRFHLGLGFAEVGRQFTDNGAKEVALLVRG